MISIPSRIEIVNENRGDIGLCKYGDTDFSLGDYGGFKKDIVNGVIVIENEKTGDDI